MPEAEYLSSILKQPLVVGLASLLVSLSLLVLPPVRGLLLRAAAIGGEASFLRQRLESRCAVCLEQVFCGEEKFRVLPECRHGFHAECVDRWLMCRRSCPLCRAMVPGDPQSIGRRLFAVLLSGFCRWMDSQFDSELTLAFCQNL